MATATVARRDATKTKEQTFLWEGVDRNNKPMRGELRAVSETVATTNLRRQGIRVVKIKRQTFRGGRSVNEKDITFFTRQLATMLPCRRAAAAIVRHHRARPQQCALLAADDGHQDQGGDRLEPVAGVPRVSQAFRRAVLQSRAGGRNGRHARRDPRSPRDVHGKDPRDQGQDQVGAVLPDHRARRRADRHVDHHGVRHSVVQAACSRASARTCRG